MARVLSGRSRLPSPADMLADCERFEERYRAAGLPLRYLHSQVPPPCRLHAVPALRRNTKDLHFAMLVGEPSHLVRLQHSCTH